MALLSDRKLSLYYLPKVAFRPTDDACWLWLAATDTTGYGRFSDDSGRLIAAHSVLKEMVDGPCPDGLDHDHVCHNRDASCPGGAACLHRRCVRPSHIEYVTRSVNIQRAYRLTTHCGNGHERNETNVYVNPITGQRICRPCSNESRRRRATERGHW